MKIFEGKNVPIKSWCNNPEEGAIEQAYNLSALPFIFKQVNLLPDTHEGYGMPIGGVIATKGVVIPNAVGVDIGCTDKNTEFLTPYGWKKMVDYNRNDKVLQFNKENNTANFVTPLKYIVEDCEEFYHFKNSKGLDQMLCKNHKILTYKGYKTKGYTITDINCSELAKLNSSLDHGYYGFKASFEIINDKLDLTENEIRLDIMVSADGHIEYNINNKNKIYLHLKKKRKIIRAKKILNSLNIPYKITPGVDGSTHIYFLISDKFNKDLSKYWKASKEQLNIICEECLLWDGHKGYRSFYSSTIKTNADVIQFAFSANDIRAGISIIKSNKWQDIYIVTPTKNNIVGFSNNIKKTKSQDGKKYCFTVPSSYLVLRRNGKIFITGNCGMCAVKTSLTGLNPDQIKAIFGGSKEHKGGIRGKVPVGFNHHTKPQDENLIPNIRKFLMEYYKKSIYQNTANPVYSQEYHSALKQLGTLGGGNHFIELQRGSDGFIWIMIHSGSRNLGYKVAKYYNKVAQELCKKWYSNIPEYKGEDGLAFLPLESAEGQSYLLEMDYCLEFAYANRKLMLERIKEAILDVTDCEFEPEINIHHNYVAMENHFGSNVMVHRKGATSAKAGQLGIIPGSQGTSSYIVKGKGAEESFKSCSHGAGRTMSRKKAIATLDLEKEIKILEDQNIIHSIRYKKNLDESSSSYKDIDVVMEEQKDLVDIVVKLTPLGVIKG